MHLKISTENTKVVNKSQHFKFIKQRFNVVITRINTKYRKIEIIKINYPIKTVQNNTSR